MTYRIRLSGGLEAAELNDFGLDASDLASVVACAAVAWGYSLTSAVYSHCVDLGEPIVCWEFCASCR